MKGHRVPAKFDLKEVKKLIQEFAAGARGKVFFSLPQASVQYVIKVFDANNMSDREAERLIIQGLLQLTDSDFHRTIWHPHWRTLMDEYGLEAYKKHNWYIKFFIDDEGDGRFLSEVSFHPLETGMSLSNGRTLDVTYRPKG